MYTVNFGKNATLFAKKKKEEEFDISQILNSNGMFIWGAYAYGVEFSPFHLIFHLHPSRSLSRSQ